MNIEEKAKAYDELLDKARKELQSCGSTDCDAAKQIFRFFPELAKSEDEIIKEELINYLKYRCDSTTVSGEERACNKWIAWLEKQGQKPGDNIKPKFKVGDWIIRSAEGFKHNTYLVTEVKDYYVCEELKGRRVTFTFNDVHKNFKLWDISDAKDGDVLVNGSNIFIFHFINDTRLMGYCHVNTDDGRFYDDIGKNTCFCLIDAVVNPATKEQRDLLFAKMRESGYKWDAEKKELKLLITNGGDFCESENCEQKPAKWGDEDENRFNNLIFLVEHSDENKATKEGFIKFINKLKSIKQRHTWKPSDAQMNAFKQVYDWYNTHFTKSLGLNSLYYDLKKLKA